MKFSKNACNYINQNKETEKFKYWYTYFHIKTYKPNEMANKAKDSNCQSITEKNLSFSKELIYKHILLTKMSIGK